MGHEETSGADPGKSLAWIVAIQVVAYYLCSSFISIIFYLGMFVYIYFRWIRPMYGFEITAKEDKHDGNDEPEWLLDQFFSYIQQHTDGDKENSSYLKEDDVTEEMIDQLEIEKDTEVPEVDDSRHGLSTHFLPTYNNIKTMKRMLIAKKWIRTSQMKRLSMMSVISKRMLEVSYWWPAVSPTAPPHLSLMPR